MKLDIFKWLSTGDFLGVKIGMPKDEVASLLGEPRGWADSKTTDQIGNFLDADIWGYGIWLLYFTENKLDAITGAICSLGKEGYCFDVDGFFPQISTSYEDVENELLAKKCRHYDLPNKFLLRNENTGETIEKRRRLRDRTLLVGDRLLGRITFDTLSGQILQIAYPYSVTAQAVGGSALVLKKQLSLVV